VSMNQGFPSRTPTAGCMAMLEREGAICEGREAGLDSVLVLAAGAGSRVLRAGARRQIGLGTSRKTWRMPKRLARCSPSALTPKVSVA
jgi:hypothetical protein